MRIARLWALVLSVALVAAACSSGDDDASSAAVDDGDGGTVAAADDGDEADGADAESATPTTVFEVEGEKITFDPPLDGPFGTDGGAVADVDTASLIVDDDPDLPGTLNGLPWDTDWTQRTVEDWDEFLAGLPQSDPRDGIPPIDTPIFESPALAAEWLAPNDPGALVQVDDEARFYPLSIMTRHEIVNDAFGEVPVAVTFCPLCNTAIAFDRRVDGEVLRFGVSGLLRNSDLVMWDDQTTSLWQQLTGEGVVGTYAGVDLEFVPTSIVSFAQFAENFPDGWSLAAESALGRGTYGANPYVGYSSSAAPFLFDGSTDDRLPALSRVVRVSDGDTVASYAFEDLAANQVVNDDVDGRPLAVFWQSGTSDALDGPRIAESQNIGTAIAHDPVVDGETLTFTAEADGVYVDDQTGSTWSVVGIATDGPLAGSRLGAVEHRNEFWFAWQAFFGADNLREFS